MIELTIDNPQERSCKIPCHNTPSAETLDLSLLLISVTKETGMRWPKTSTGTVPLQVPGLNEKCFPWFKMYGS